MQNLAAGIITELAIMAGVVVAAALNPSSSHYADWTIGRMTQETDPEFRTKAAASAVKSEMTLAVTSADYLLCTLYRLTIEGKRFSALGLFGFFIPLREDAGFKDSFRTQVLLKIDPPPKPAMQVETRVIDQVE